MPLLLSGITMWSGLVEEIPVGWVLCNGQNGTPDLRNRFIVGAGGLYAVGNTGGSANAVVVSHNHSATVNSGGGHSHSFYSRNDMNLNAGPEAPQGTFPRAFQNSSVNLANVGTNATGNHSHTVTINNTGVSETNANLPPYYALAFIQQIE
jgi:microcystin-dependent protein